MAQTALARYTPGEPTLADIKPYTSQVVAQGARGTAQQFGSDVAQATSGLGNAVADTGQKIYDYQVQQDVNDVQVTMAKARADWTTQLKNRANQAQPGDESFTPKLMEDMQSYFNDLSSTVKTNKGREVFNTMAANLQTDFLARGISTQSALAAQGAKQNVIQFQDASGKTVAQDPTQRDSVLGSTAKYIASLPNIDQVTRAQLKYDAEQYINTATVQGQIQRNPDALLSRIDPKDLEPGNQARSLRTGDPAFDALPADEQYKLVKQAREYSNAYRADDERKRREEERAKKEAQEKDLNGYTTRILAPGGNNGPIPSAREIMANPTLESSQKEHLVRLSWAAENERSDGSATKPHPQNVQRLYSRIVATQDDPKKIVSEQEIQSEFIKGNLNRTELDWLVTNVRDLRDPDKAPFTKEVNATLQSIEKALASDPVLRGLGKASANVMPDVMARARFDLTSEIERLRKEGKNPRDLITPGSREYFFTNGRMLNYMQAAEQSVTQRPVNPSVEQRQPGESIQDWQARTGRK